VQFSHLKSLDASYPGLEGAGGGRFSDPASYVGLICVGSWPCSEGLSSGTPGFVPQQKLTCSLCWLFKAVHQGHAWTVQWLPAAPIYVFGPTLLSCVLAVLARAISEAVIIIIIRDPHTGRSKIWSGGGSSYVKSFIVVTLTLNWVLEGLGLLWPFVPTY